MPILVLPLEIADVPAWVDINERAFTETGRLWRIFYPTPLCAESKAVMASSRMQQLANPNTWAFKAVDSETGAIMGCAKWNVFPHPRTEAEVAAGETLPTPLPEQDPAVINAFLRALYTSRRLALGTRPHLELATLTIDPKHQGKGAGKALVAWGTKFADEHGLEAYLEASEMGRPLYMKAGFETVHVLDFDMEKKYDVDETLIMIRKPILGS